MQSSLRYVAMRCRELLSKIDIFMNHNNLQRFMSMCKTFPFFGSERGNDALTKIRALHAHAHQQDKDVIGWLYGALNILDAKANGLLRVNAFFITIITFLIGLPIATENTISVPDLSGWVGSLSLALFLLSTVSCFLIIRVKWKFLGKVAPASSGQSFNFAPETEDLAKVVDDRTHYYWLAWGGTILGLIAFAWQILGWFVPAVPCYVGLC